MSEHRGPIAEDRQRQQDEPDVTHCDSINRWDRIVVPTRPGGDPPGGSK